MITAAHTRAVLVGLLAIALLWEAVALAWGTRESTISMQMQAAGKAQPFIVIGAYLALGAHFWWPTP